jgi:putative hemolysin
MEEILVISVCVLLNAILAAYEMAFVSVPRPELRKLARSGNAHAQRLLNLRENPERTLSIIQVGITLVGAISAAVGGVGAAEDIVPYFRTRFGMSETGAEFLSIFLIVLPLTYISVVLGELVPKTLALRNPVRITLLGARWLFIADRLLSPGISLLEGSTRQLLRVFFPRSKAQTPQSETTVEIDSLPQHHQQAVLNLARLEQRRNKDILLPWKDIVFVRDSDSMDDVVPVVFASGHTRLPVTNNGDVVGILHTKEFLAFRESGAKDWRSILRPILKVQANDPVLGTLRLMQARHSHMATVFTGTGERLGIVTLEDITEEIWGDIYDEDEESATRKVFVDRVKSKALRSGAGT